ncbi:transcription factor bHLH47 [Nicotiana tabacum]|uniref:Transcription factor bHLH47 n=2 Tax=Nicotiana TaxID=4085 RepID=A0A1S4A365_TOBAC|nr:PREDICTED: transcription factor bHLH47-like [Nicotiana sylvestris]XP_009770549.1 PREDICTED: transcription factor bHLH47-like [Nicotiana sylvestris]XP_016471010.1 PREDICTED: transcription factor bHLH47-like [Nicotiana tabacum]XP_016471011.1 PREDICTED: transcription factor bHLH47-like [Nicotiana tabacum]
MDTESPAPIHEKDTTAAETSLDSSHLGKKNQKKAPKRIHKAEREKLKREHLNELFLGLANALELSEQMNGKASILNEAARFVKDILSQIKHLRTENTTLLSESQYLSVEKKELQDETSALEAEIGRLQNEVKAREAKTNLDLNLAPPEIQHPEFALQNNYMRLPASAHAFQDSQIMNPAYVFPFSSNPQVHLAPDATKSTSTPTSTVKKPQARYPTPADVWPSQIFEKRPRLLGQEVQDGA